MRIVEVEQVMEAKMVWVNEVTRLNPRSDVLVVQEKADLDYYRSCKAVNQLEEKICTETYKSKNGK